MKPLIIAASISLAAAPAWAVESTQPMLDYANAQVEQWIAIPMVIAAIKAQNASTSGVDQATIDEMDQTWRAQVESDDRPMIEAVLANPVSQHLMLEVAQSQGRITEVFVMDARGLNVGQSAMTSDYWQGDEAKFTETYAKGDGAVHMGEIELDESTSTYQGQVSLSITDPETGTVIGAVTFGLNAQAFF